MILYLILIFLLLFFCWILFVPIRLVVNTETKQFYIKQAGLFKLTFETDDTELVYLRIRVFLFSFNVYPIRDFISGFKTQPNKKRKKKPRKKKKRKISIRTIQLLFKIAKSSLSTFKLEKLIVNLDTSDVIANAYLFPAGEISSGENIRLSINNSDHFFIELLIKNTVFMIVLAVLKSIIFHHIHK